MPFVRFWNLDMKSLYIISLFHAHLASHRPDSFPENSASSFCMATECTNIHLSYLNVQEKKTNDNFHFNNGICMSRKLQTTKSYQASYKTPYSLISTDIYFIPHITYTCNKDLRLILSIIMLQTLHVKYAMRLV
jgi:hypothetical protein